MQQAVYHTPNHKTTTYTPLPKYQTPTLPSLSTSFSPATHQEINRTDQRYNFYQQNHNGNHNKSFQFYYPTETKSHEFEHIGRTWKGGPQKNYEKNLEHSFTTAEIKNPYIGGEAGEGVPTKTVLSEHLKRNQKIQRGSEPIPRHKLSKNITIDRMENKEQEPVPETKGQNEDLTASSRKVLGHSSNRIDPEDRARMRNSSYDPMQGWMRGGSKKKVERKLTLNDFEKISDLGTGKYGKVFLAKEKASEFLCALKIIEKQLLKDEEITQQFVRELKIQMFVNHPNIIKMYGYFEDSSNIYIILEVALGGHLYNIIRPGSAMPEVQVAGIMRQVVSALGELHSHHIIHRDIKPENIVMNQNVLKLCDFGWSVYHGQGLRTTFCGTPLYVSPQILKGNNYDEKIDIWSLGVMMYEMLVDQNPFKITHQQQLINIVKNTVTFPSYSNISSEAQDFVMRCLTKSPQQRANIRQLMNHQFFKKYPQKDKKSRV